MKSTRTKTSSGTWVNTAACRIFCRDQAGTAHRSVWINRADMPDHAASIGSSIQPYSCVLHQRFLPESEIKNTGVNGAGIHLPPCRRTFFCVNTHHLLARVICPIQSLPTALVRRTVDQSSIQSWQAAAEFEILATLPCRVNCRRRQLKFQEPSCSLTDLSSSPVSSGSAGWILICFGT